MALGKTFRRPRGKKLILLIEDDSDLIEMYKMKLELEGFSVLIFQDGKHALKIMRDTKPDLVLLDILMPGKDGFSILKEKAACHLREIRNIPVVVLTNLASPKDRARGKELGAKDWWIKAFLTPSEIAQKVKKILN